MPLLEWMTQYRIMLNPSTRFDLARHRYLAGIYSCETPRRAIMKSGQSGISEYAVSYMLHALDQRRMNVLYLLPTVSDVSDFSQMRIGPAIEASDYLQSIVVDGREGGQRGADRVRLKRLRTNFLVLRGAQVHRGGQAGERRGASQIKAVPADAVVYDELDEMPAGVEALGEKRLGHSEEKETLFLSTPTYPGMGIHAKWEESDQRHWLIPCPHCGRRQALTIKHVVADWDDLERPLAWHGQAEGRAYAACERCGRELDRLADGEWVAAYPGREMAGFSFNKLATAQTEPLAVVQALLTTDEHKRQEAYNQDLGVPYRPRGSGIVDAELDAAQRQYAHGVRANEVGCVAGVDVGRVLHVIIRGPADRGTGERPQRWAAEVSSFDELGRVLRKYRVRCCVMDAQPETHKAREFQQSGKRGQVWLCYFGSDVDRKAPMAQWKEDGAESRAQAWSGTVTADRTRAFDELYAALTGGALTLPAHIKDVRDYYEHLKAPVRVLEKHRRTGQEVARYVSVGPDHYALAELYCLLAAQAPRPSLGILVQRTTKGW